MMLLELGFKEVNNVGMIKFKKEDVIILIDDRNRLYVVYKESGNKEDIVDIDVKLHLAITNELRELGWFE